MSDRGLLMRGEMVRATRAGLKTQTRRTEGLEEINVEPDKWRCIGVHGGRFTFENSALPVEMDAVLPETVSLFSVAYPKGGPGDRLWIKETHTVNSDGSVSYRADKLASDLNVKWKPSLFMPKKLARLWLEITGISVERLHAITETDAKAEGVEPVFPPGVGPGKYALGFRAIWIKINGADSWKKNPWVFVITFRKLGKQK